MQRYLQWSSKCFRKYFTDRNLRNCNNHIRTCVSRSKSGISKIKHEINLKNGLRLSFVFVGFFNIRTETVLIFISTQKKILPQRGQQLDIR
jgi:hypothetical protein